LQGIRREKALKDSRIFEFIGPALLQRCCNLRLDKILLGKSARHSGNSHIKKPSLGTEEALA
jgi:hypothetical protein